MGEVFTYILLVAVAAGMLSLKLLVLRILWRLDIGAWRDLRAKWPSRGGLH
jgi:hypothetical protein